LGTIGSLALGFVTGGVGVGAEATVVVVNGTRDVVGLGNVGFRLKATVVVAIEIVFGAVVAGKVV